MDESVVEYLLGMLGSAVGALAAGLLGVRLGVAKLRSERSYERRLAWLEEAAVVTREYARCLYNMLHVERVGAKNPENIEVWKELGTVVDRFFEVVPRSHLYASRRTHQLLGEVSRRANSLASRIGAEETPRPNEEQLQAFDQLRNLMLRTSMELTHDLRDHLGLEDLRGPVWQRAWRRIRNRGRNTDTPVEAPNGSLPPAA